MNRVLGISSLLGTQWGLSRVFVWIMLLTYPAVWHTVRYMKYMFMNPILDISTCFYTMRYMNNICMNHVLVISNCLVHSEVCVAFLYDSCSWNIRLFDIQWVTLNIFVWIMFLTMLFWLLPPVVCVYLMCSVQSHTPCCFKLHSCLSVVYSDLKCIDFAWLVQLHRAR